MAITFVGAASAASTSVSLPTFQPGDVAVVLAMRSTDSTQPSLPSGWRSIGSGGATYGFRMGLRVLQSGDTTTGTWTNATQVGVAVYRGVQQDEPLVGGTSFPWASNEGSTTSVSWSAPSSVGVVYTGAIEIVLALAVSATTINEISDDSPLWTNRTTGADSIFGVADAAYNASAGAFTQSQAVGWVTTATRLREDNGFPQVVDQDTQSGTVTSNSSSWTLTYPTNLQDGDLILAQFAADGGGNFNAGMPSGWVQFGAAASPGAVTAQMLAKRSDGTETGTFSATCSASEQGSWRLLRIVGAYDNGNRPWLQTDADHTLAAGLATGASSTPDPAATNPYNWAAEKTLWIATMAADTSRTVSDWPDSTVDNGSLVSGGSGGATLAWARLESAVVMWNPTTFTISSSDDWATVTIGIRPAWETKETSAASSDDGHWLGNSANINTAGTAMWVGDHDVNAYDITAGMRFTGVAIPQGATIDSAILYIYAECSADKPALTFDGEDVDDAATFSTYSDATGRTHTTASVASGANGLWESGSKTWSGIPVASIIEEIVGRAGWVSGNDLVLFALNPTPTGWTGTASYVAIDTYDAGANTRPYLVINWTPSSGTNYPRTASDTVTIGTDSVGRLKAAQRAIAETTSLTESVARTASFTRTVTDTVTIGTDSVAQTRAVARPISDTTSVTEDLVRLYGGIRAPPDTTSLSESVTRTLAATRSATDTSSATDSVARQIGRIRTPGQSTAVLPSTNGSIGILVASEPPNEPTGGTLARFTPTSDPPAGTEWRLEARFRLRSPGTADQFHAAEVLWTSSGASLYIRSRVDGSGKNTVLAGPLALPVAPQWGGSFSVRVASVGAVVRAKAWSSFESEPDWQLTATDSAPIPDYGNWAGFVTRVAGNNTPVTTVTVWQTLPPTVDTLARQVAAARSTADTTTVSESVSRTAALTRTATDTVSTSDSISSSTQQPAQTRTATDTTSVSEDLVRLYGAIRAPPDTVSTSDSVAHSRGYTRQPTDTTSTSDAIAEETGTSRTVTDTVSTSESIAATKAASRTATDTTSVSDSVARALAAARSATDTTSTSESVGTSVGETRAVTDTVSTSESIARTLGATRTATDTVTTSDSLSSAHVAAVRLFVYEVELEVPGSVGAANYTRTASDTVTTSESVARTLSASRPISDSTTTTDSVARAVGTSRTATDTTTVSDSVARTLAASRPLLETLSSSDSVARTLAATRAASDTVSVSESVAHAIAATRTATDTTSVTDSIASALAATRTASDSTSLSESVARALAATRTATDTVTTTDSIASPAAHSRTASDSTTTTDSLAARTDLYRTPTDTTTVSESVARTLAATRTAADTTTLSEAVSASTVGEQFLTDSTSVTDSVSRALAAARSATDNTSLSEAISSFAAHARTASDTTTTTDSLVSTYTPGAGAFTRTASDTVSTSESVARNQTLTRALSDTTSTSESAAASRQLTRTATDTTTVTEAVASLAGQLRALSETTTVSESVARSAVLFRSASDTVTTTESMAVGGPQDRFAVDTLSTSDTVTSYFSRYTADPVHAVISVDGVEATLSVDHAASTLAVDTVHATLEVDTAHSVLSVDHVEVR